MTTRTTSKSDVDRGDTQTMCQDALVFDDFRRRSEHAFMYETAPRRRALDFYMRMLDTGVDAVDSLVERCLSTSAPLLSVASLLKLGLPRKLALTTIASVKKLRISPYEEWYAVVLAVSYRDADQRSMKLSATRLRVKRAYVASVQALVGLVAVAVGTIALAGDNSKFVRLLHTLAYAHYTLAAELLQHSPLLNLWYDINEAIGPERDSQVAWWHSSVVADWHQRIQTRQSPAERGSHPTLDSVLWVEWDPARVSCPGRARIVERVHRSDIRLWWETSAVVWSRQNATEFDWVTLVFGRVVFYAERCRHSARIAPRLNAPLRDAEHAHRRTLSRHSTYACPLADVATIDRRTTQIRMLRGILRLRPGRRSARAAVGDLRAAYSDLWAFVRQPGGDTFENVCALAATTVALMEALHLVAAHRQLATVVQASSFVATLLAAQRQPTCDAWKVRVSARSAAAHWLDRARNVDALVRVRDVAARRRADFRRYTASVNVAIDGSRLIDPRVAVGSFLLRSFDAKLAVFCRTESFVASSQ